MAKFFLDVDETLLQQSNQIFEDIGIDVAIAVKMFLKRVTKEQSLAFLLTSPSVAPKNAYVNNDTLPETVYEREGAEYYDGLQLNKNEPMNKSRAIRLLLAKGYDLKKTVTFSSRNRGSTRYWANPNFEVLKENWSLILHDWGERVIYLLEIPANSISKDQMKGRADKQEMIDLQIMYQDVTFTDNRSGLSFLKYYKGKINY